MKKILSVLLLALSLTACNNQWNQADPDMPADLIEYNQTILDEQLAILEEDPKNLDALFEVAFRYQQLGDWKKAVSYYEQVLEQAENDWVTLNNLAHMYETMGDYETAAKHIKKLYEADPTNTEVIKDTVRILLKAGDAESAQQALENFATATDSGENTNPDTLALVSELYSDIYDWKKENE